MTKDLMYLAWTALLTAALWVPYIGGQILANGMLAAENYRDPTPRPVSLWVQRANRVHLNAVEAFGPFAALVLVAHVAGAANEMTAMWAATFFWSRIGHAIIYWMGVPFLRTLVFAAGFVSIIGIFYEIAT